MAIGCATHYANIEKELRDLLRKVTHRLPVRHLAEATEFLAAREYGLALEAVSEGLRATEHMDPVFASRIMKLAHEMEIENQPFVKALASR
ncbi:MAG: hypothetical protein J2P47_11235 [Acetobacteraceae bacterium]|nr:hypothetical protein [Acetobacteraceae bacterium]